MIAPLQAQPSSTSADTDKIFPARVATTILPANVITMGLSVSSEYDDNFLSDNVNKQSNLMTIIEPHFAWNWSRGRLGWLVDTRNGFSASAQSSADRSRSHAVDATLRFRQNKRLTITLTNSFLESTNPFDFFRAADSSPGNGAGIPQRPTDFIPGSTAHTRSERAAASVSYALSAHGQMGLSGSFFNVKHSVAASSQLPAEFVGDEASFGVRGFYAHQLARHQGMDLAYKLEKLSGRNGTSLIHSVLYTQTISLSSTSKLSVFTGPEVALMRNGFAAPDPTLNAVPARLFAWHWAGGATYNWKAGKNQLALSLSRTIGNGSGLLGAVRLTSVTAGWSRKIARGWTADLSSSHDRDVTLDDAKTKLSFLWVSGGLTHALSQDLSVALKYWRVHQGASNSALGSSLADHNRAAVTLVYEHREAMGR